MNNFFPPQKSVLSVTPFKLHFTNLSAVKQSRLTYSLLRFICIIKFTPFLLTLLCLLTQCKSDNTPVTPKSSAKNMDSPVVAGVSGATSTFDAATNTFTVIVPGGTDITALKFSFTLPTGATVNPASGSAQDFTNPVTYTVTAEDGTTQKYTVKVSYKSIWATSQDRYDAIRLKAQRIAGATVSSAIPSVSFVNLTSVTDVDAAYLINTAEFTKGYSDDKGVSWQAIDKNKLEIYFVSLTTATGQLRVDKGINVTLLANGSWSSYKPGWFIIYTK